MPSGWPACVCNDINIPQGQDTKGLYGVNHVTVWKGEHTATVWLARLPACTENKHTALPGRSVNHLLACLACLCAEKTMPHATSACTSDTLNVP